MTSATHGCAACGRPITVTSRNPNRRDCTARCRLADWHRRNRTRHPNAVPAAMSISTIDSIEITPTKHWRRATSAPAGSRFSGSHRRSTSRDSAGPHSTGKSTPLRAHLLPPQGHGPRVSTVGRDRRSVRRSTGPLQPRHASPAHPPFPVRRGRQVPGAGSGQAGLGSRSAITTSSARSARSRRISRSISAI